MNQELIAEFLKIIYKNKTSGVLSFETQDKGREMFRSDNLTDLLVWIDKMEQRQRGVHLRQSSMDGESRTCTKADVVAINHLWIDIDTGIVPKILFESKILRPTFCINSGRGIHLYWRLAKPIEDQVGISQCENIMRKLCSLFGGDPAPTHSASTLRIPGSINFKYDPPIQTSNVNAIKCDRLKDYNLSDFENFLETNMDPYERLIDNITEGMGISKSASDWQKIIDNLAISGSDNEFGGRHNCVTKLAGYWTRQSVNPEVQLKTLVQYGCTLNEYECRNIIDWAWEKHSQ
tara:strand:- start:2926 stop:3798 length:873 start_codon:yes stop_codon:yes gene_type:complete